MTTPAKLARALDIPIISPVLIPFLSDFLGTTISQPGYIFGYDLKNRNRFVVAALPLA